MVEDEAEARKARPKGRDRYKRKEADVLIAKKVLENKKAAATNSAVSVQHQVVDLISDLGGNMMCQWTQDSDIRFAKMLPDAQKQQWCSELFEIKMLEAHVKKRKLLDKLRNKNSGTIENSSPSSSIPSGRSTLYSNDSEDDDDVVLASLSEEGGFVREHEDEN